MMLGSLQDPFGHGHMGITAENISDRYQISRDMQDQFALTSQKRASEAITNGLFKEQIKPIEVKTGENVTVVAWSGMVSTALEAAEQLKNDNISVEVIDLRTIFPLDEEIILKSIEKTSNLVILQEDVPFSSIASEISSVVAEKGFWNLDNPILKVTSPNTHIPFAPVLEDAFIPSAENLIKAIKELQ